MINHRADLRRHLNHENSWHDGAPGDVAACPEFIWALSLDPNTEALFQIQHYDSIDLLKLISLRIQHENFFFGYGDVVRIDRTQVDYGF